MLQGTPFVPLTRFNHTLVMGGLLAGVVLWVPVFLVFRGLAGINRTRLRERIAGSRFAKAIGRIPLVSAVGKAVQAISSALPSAG
ncbi:MAG: hypothetical protein NTU62_07880 [Spirochaetes bacterium]|nr:hypothetical protein [Spirochaetota bacterium]